MELMKYHTNTLVKNFSQKNTLVVKNVKAPKISIVDLNGKVDSTRDEHNLKVVKNKIKLRIKKLNEL